MHTHLLHPKGSGLMHWKRHVQPIKYLCEFLYYFKTCKGNFFVHNLRKISLLKMYIFRDNDTNWTIMYIVRAGGVCMCTFKYHIQYLTVIKLYMK